MSPRVLALDTSTETLAVALQAGGRRWCHQGPGGAAASAQLLPQVRAMLAQAGLTVADLDAVAFGQGPGAFTGLRTACSVAQGLAFGAGLPLVPVDSLLIVAQDLLRRLGGVEPLDVGVVMDARMGEVYAARYLWTQGAWTVTTPAGLFSPQDLPLLWTTSCAHLAGNGLHLCPWGAALSACGDCGGESADRAASLLDLALMALAAGRTVSPAEAAPVYLRDKVALTTAERQRSAKACGEGAAAPAAGGDRHALGTSRLDSLSRVPAGSGPGLESAA